MPRASRRSWRRLLRNRFVLNIDVHMAAQALLGRFLFHGNRPCSADLRVSALFGN